MDSKSEAAWRGYFAGKHGVEENGIRFAPGIEVDIGDLEPTPAYRVFGVFICMQCTPSPDGILAGGIVGFKKTPTGSEPPGWKPTIGGDLKDFAPHYKGKVKCPTYAFVPTVTYENARGLLDELVSQGAEELPFPSHLRRG